MKKFMLIWLMTVVLALCAGALADVIWIPMDSFYEMHASECVKSGRRYEARSDMNIYDQPDGKVTGSIKAGEAVYLYCTWQDSWGALDWKNGWVRLSDLRRYYDEDDFYAEHFSQIFTVEGALLLGEDKVQIKWNYMPDEIKDAAGAQVSEASYPANLWAYPGSNMIRRSFGSGGVSSSITFNSAYVDESGALWLRFSGYLYGRYEGWMYASDLSSETPPFVGRIYADTDEAEREDGKGEKVPAGVTGANGNGGPGGSLLLPAVAVAGVMLITAALLIVMRRRTRTQGA